VNLKVDPTQQGGTEEVTPNPAENPRNAVMAQIASQAAASVADEMSSFDETTGEIHAPEQGTEQQQAAAPTETHDDGAADPAPAAEAAKPRMVSIVVDGQTIEVDEARIVEAGKRTLQKDHAADRRLQEAARERQQAQAMRQQVEQQAAYVRQVAQQHGIELQAPSSDAPQQQPQATQVDPDALKGFVKSLVYNERAETAADQFWREFPDIAGDPYLRQMAASLENERLATAAAVGEPLGDPYAAYRKHGETIRDWLKQRTAPAAAATASTDKVDRKRTITVAPAANARAPAPTAPKVLSVSEQIEQMRQRRQSGRTVFNQIR
jgi:hypothetical protein